MATGEASDPLAAANTYTGNTTVAAGTLSLGASGSINSSPTITVGTGATFYVSAVTGGYTVGGANAQVLQGTGTVLGTTTVEANGAIRGDSGTGTGTLTTGNVTVASGGRVGVQLGSSNTASKLDTSAGLLTLNSGAIIAPNGTFNSVDGHTLATLTPGGGLVVNSTAVNTDTAIGSYTYQTADAGQVKAFDGTSGLQIDLAGLSLSQGDQLALARSGNSLVLNFSPVPEPALMLTVAAVAAGVVGWVRRKKRGGVPSPTNG